LTGDKDGPGGGAGKERTVLPALAAPRAGVALEQRLAPLQTVAATELAAGGVGRARIGGAGFVGLGGGVEGDGELGCAALGGQAEVLDGEECIQRPRFYDLAVGKAGGDALWGLGIHRMARSKPVNGSETREGGLGDIPTSSC
jgi:hypothetical protein